jgi:uncharacterized protein (DUF433 family)
LTRTSPTQDREEADVTVLIGQGVYGISEAARLTGLKPSRVREWFRGRPPRGTKPVFHSDYPPVGGDFAVSFHDLVEVYVSGRLRDHGVSLQTLRKVHGRMKKDLQSDHPFCRQELLSDGKVVFARNVDEAGREELAEVLTGQKVFPQIILPFLKRIDYERLLARRWRIAERVVVDPAICLGKPTVQGIGIATAILAASYQANGEDAEAVAGWYDVHADDVSAAVRFERGQAA